MNDFEVPRFFYLGSSCKFSLSSIFGLSCWFFWGSGNFSKIGLDWGWSFYYGMGRKEACSYSGFGSGTTYASLLVLWASRELFCPLGPSCCDYWWSLLCWVSVGKLILCSKGLKKRLFYIAYDSGKLKSSSTTKLSRFLSAFWEAMTSLRPLIWSINLSGLESIWRMIHFYIPRFSLFLSRYSFDSSDLIDYCLLF